MFNLGEPKMNLVSNYLKYLKDLVIEWSSAII